MFNEGFTIMKKKETTLARLGYKCPNPSCGRTFSKPLRTIDLSQQDPEPYEACPHCLTEISNQENNPATQTSKEVPEASEIAETPPVVATEKSASTATRCNRHFGFLSERSSKEKIPEECVTCTEIVNCMLKEIKKQTD